MRYNYKGEKVKLHGIFQHSYIVEQSLMIGGHGGGQISYPIAIVEYENGDIENVDTHELKGWSDEE